MGDEVVSENFGSWEVYEWVKSLPGSEECWEIAKFTLQGTQKGLGI